MLQLTFTAFLIICYENIPKSRWSATNAFKTLEYIAIMLSRKSEGEIPEALYENDPFPAPLPIIS